VRSRTGSPAPEPGTGGRGRKGGNEKSVLVLEWSDRREFARWVDGVKVNGVEHDLGFNLFEQVPFIQVPDEPWNMGAVEQAVGLVEAGNALYSLVMQSMLENVFPRLVLEDPMKFSETIDTGPGAVIPVNQGGKAYYLNPSPVGVAEGVNMIAQNEAAIKQDTSMPDVNFGNFNASIITGKAINELQGAGTGSVVEMVQGTGIGFSLARWNEKALTIYQRMFKNDRCYLQGVRPRANSDLVPQQFTLSFKGSQIVGSPRNEVIFSPYVGQHDKLIMGLQGLGAGLFSKAYVREQVGVPDSDDMEEQIVGEALDSAVIGGIVAHLQAEPTEEVATQTAAQVSAYYGGPAAPAHPLLSMGVGAPPGPQQGVPARLRLAHRDRQDRRKLAAARSSRTSRPAARTGWGPQQSQTVTLDSVVAAFQSIQGITGRVFLVGEIVQRGQTDGDIEVALTKDDRQVIQQALPQFTGRLVFKSVPDEPQERFVEVTPGKPSRQGGAEKPSPEALKRVFVG
jgi:hypothetical protein